MEHSANRRWVRTHGLPLALAGLGGLLWLLGAGVLVGPAAGAAPVASPDWPIPFDKDARRLYAEDYEDGKCDRIQEGSSAAVVSRDDGADVHAGRYCLRGNFDTKTTDPLTRKRGKSRYAGLADIKLPGAGRALYVSYWWRLDPDDKFEAEPPSNFGGQKHAYITGSAEPWANKVNYVVGQAWGFEHWWIVNNSPNKESKPFGANARVDAESAKPGVWHRVEFYLRLESAPGKGDGVAILKIDGKLAIDRRDVPFEQGLPQQTWSRMALPSMFGGGTGPKESFGWQLDDLQIWSGLPQVR